MVKGKGIKMKLIDICSEYKMLHEIQRTLDQLAFIAYKHDEISRGRLWELTNKSPETLAASIASIEKESRNENN